MTLMQNRSIVQERNEKLCEALQKAKSAKRKQNKRFRTKHHPDYKVVSADLLRHAKDQAIEVNSLHQEISYWQMRLSPPKTPLTIQKISLQQSRMVKRTTLTFGKQVITCKI